jgi:hypothetical protein
MRFLDRIQGTFNNGLQDRRSNEGILKGCAVYTEIDDDTGRTVWQGQQEKQERRKD